jgi:hypothetical protein
VAGSPPLVEPIHLTAARDSLLSAILLHVNKL